MKNTQIHVVTVTQSDGKKDKLFLRNTNLLKSIEIKYEVQQHNYEDTISFGNI